MILIYSHNLTSRLRYIFKTIFSDILKSQIEFTDDLEKYKNFDGAKISYTTSNPQSGIFFQSSSLLFETGIKEQNISTFEFNKNKCFFRVGEESELPFDPFAASFYLISRYEEYLPHIRDKHDRYTASQSLAYQNGFIEIPVVNIWIDEIEKRIRNSFVGFKFPQRDYTFIPTIDVDNAFAYTNKGVLRSFGGLVRSIYRFDGHEFDSRVKTIFRKQKDPFDTFEYLFDVHRKFRSKPIYFFLLGEYGKYDKNIPVNNKNLHQLIKGVSDYQKVGIHPSYSSNYDTAKLKKEINILHTITHKDVVRSRQHFLKLTLPDTYRNLIDNDITEDYSLGYAEESGFRASICTPFYFYDLDMECETKLLLFPFTIMDATYIYYKNLPLEEVIHKVRGLVRTVKKSKGTFISIVHNETLSEMKKWKGWKEIYEQQLKEASNN